MHHSNRLTESAKMLAIITLFFAIGLVYVPQSLAQPKNTANSTEINWLQVGITSTVIATAISSIVNYVIADTKIKHDQKSAMEQIQKNYENELNRMEKQRQVDSIKEKVQVYSFFIFNLDRIIRNPQFREGTEKPELLQKTVSEIDDEIKSKYYLINPDVLIKWLSSRHELKERFTNMFYTKEIIKKVIVLRNRLVSEYNDSISPQYKEITGITIDKIEPPEMDIEELEKYSIK